MYFPGPGLGRSVKGWCSPAAEDGGWGRLPATAGRGFLRPAGHRAVPARLAPVIDLKRAAEPDRYRAALARRGAADDFDALLAADPRWREHTERAEALRAAQKRSSKGARPARPRSPSCAS